MKRSANILPVLLLLSSLVYSSCSVSRERDFDTDLDGFRSWVNHKATHLAELSERDWENAKADFRVRTNELDRSQDQLTDELKEEYKLLKQRFRELDAEHREQLALKGWRRDLLGKYADTTKINSANAVAAYEYFMTSVRARQKEWSEQEWELTHQVYKILNKRIEALKGALSTEDEVKIKALQMEYTTLDATP